MFPGLCRRRKTSNRCEMMVDVVDTGWFGNFPFPCMLDRGLTLKKIRSIKNRKKRRDHKKNLKIFFSIIPTIFLLIERDSQINIHRTNQPNQPTDRSIMTFSTSLQTTMTTATTMLLLLLLSSPMDYFVANVDAQQQDSCGSFSIVAAPSLAPLVTAWVNQYNIQECVSQSASRAAITVETGGSSDSIARACGTLSGSTTVDIAGMTRLPFPGEASTGNGWYYECQRSTRDVINVSD